jgi:hypothetical protein
MARVRTPLLRRDAVSLQAAYVAPAAMNMRLARHQRVLRAPVMTVGRISPDSV